METVVVQEHFKFKNLKLKRWAIVEITIKIEISILVGISNLPEEHTIKYFS